MLRLGANERNLPGKVNTGVVTGRHPKSTQGAAPDLTSPWGISAAQAGSGGQGPLSGGEAAARAHVCHLPAGRRRLQLPQLLRGTAGTSTARAGQRTGGGLTQQVLETCLSGRGAAFGLPPSAPPHWPVTWPLRASTALYVGWDSSAHSVDLCENQAM